MRFPLATLVAVSLWASSAQAIYFYIDGQNPKCFYEDLPKDTLVVGKYYHFEHGQVFLCQHLQEIVASLRPSFKELTSSLTFT